ncbi:hypothetical protein [Enterobacter kobei]|uniref:hypothetical protein n=1 Tax=Enterobacter kobei TaxID=208224 RepID=UPI0021C107F0|nr:hypothetical protein [Enterobacter kobei]UXJ66658.1 hypothetical protein N5P26_21965 [Enterobacter kobei]
MCVIITSNNFLKIGIQNVVECLDLNSENLVFIDIQENIQENIYGEDKKIMLISDDRKKNAAELIMSNTNYKVISSKESVNNIVKAIKNFINQESKKIRGITLSDYEKYLLQYFLTDINMQAVSVVTGISRKKLYSARSRICLKLGIEGTRDLFTLPDTLKYRLV